MANHLTPAMDHYQKIEKVIEYLNDHRLEQPSLKAVARHIHLSEFHLQRLFSEWVGISPKAFLKQITMQHARKLLHEGGSVLETALDVGLSGPGRLHDLCVSLEAATPGEIKSGGRGWTIQYGFYESPFGLSILCLNDRGICHLSFIDHADKEMALTTAQAEWPHANMLHTPKLIQEVGFKVFTPRSQGNRLKAFVKGTEMQVKVWKALLEIPSGQVTTYGDIAVAIGKPKAARTVGTAIGKNSIAYLIPCHRVIRKTGVVSDYRWGRVRKQAILATEKIG